MLPDTPADGGTQRVLTRRTVFSWALYDWANSAFATTVMAGFFPVFFSAYWSGDSVDTTFRLGMANTIASLCVALLAPVMGAIGDRAGRRKSLLLSFAALGVVMTAALYAVAQGQWLLAAAVYVCATIGFALANVFYDSMIVDVAGDDETDLVSAFGYSLGYLGGGLLFAVNVVMTLKPEMFGIADKATAVRLSFLTVALWWALFSIPLARNVRVPAVAAVSGAGAAIRGGLNELRATFGRVRSLRPVWMFLIAYWLYIDGVYTIIKMAVDYGIRLGFPSDSLIVALLITQFVGFPAALAFGWLGKRFGTRRGILTGIAVYVAVTLWAFWLDNVTEFYLMAMTIGLVQGGVQSLSRAYYARLIPADRAGEFFGFFNMLGKFAAVLGPALMGVVAVTTGSARAGILAVAVLFVAGALVLTRVADPAVRSPSV